MIIIIILIIGLILLFILHSKIKKLKLDNITFINGGVGTGKTSLAVSLAIKQYKKNHFKWRIKNFFSVLIKKHPIEEPLLYSNIPLAIVSYVPITTDMLLRKVRFRFKSVVLLSEVSLVSDSMDFNDKDRNERTMMFVKLIRHELHGGSMFIESQSPKDMSYSFKRSINKCVWIHSCMRKLPFIMIYKVRELMWSEELGTNNFEDDIENSTKLLFISKSVFKKYDTYCYSCFTDNLPIVDQTITQNKLSKLDDIVSFKNYNKYIKGEIHNENDK